MQKNGITNLNTKRTDEKFNAVSVSVASPDIIRSWSFGEVTKPETINYRTLKPERGGLFCASIFGPVKDFECLCGKYKRRKYLGIRCEKCGVEVLPRKVRRERMAHIDLAAPVVHIWYLRSISSSLAILLDMMLKDIMRVLYFDFYVITDPGLTELKYKQTINEETLAEMQDKYGDNAFSVSIGADAIKTLLSQIKLEEEIETYRQILSTTELTELKRRKIIKRFKILESFANNSIKQEWMILDVLPVLPPALRPLIHLDKGRFATSDLNELYRRVINRNNRLKRLLELDAPDIIVHNEKRMLQEAVDSLFDNSRCSKPVLTTNKRLLKSLSDNLKGKQGRFRQNLLGKRVDYSGRSVIVVGPDLKLNQCGLPKIMALELFKPFIFSRLLKDDIVSSIKAAKKMVENTENEVWDVLEKVIKNHTVLLNRAPTLHRLGIQAFEPILIEGKAIQLHPLVCAAFNADFDGDQMAVHVPLSTEAQLESRVLMMSANNLLSPSNGEPVIVHSQDIILGIYYLSLPGKIKSNQRYSITNKDTFIAGINSGNLIVQDNKKKEILTDTNEKLYKKVKDNKAKAYRIKTFSSPVEVKLALFNKFIALHDLIRVKLDNAPQGDYILGTPAKLILNEVLPEGKDFPFSLIDKVLTKSGISDLILYSYKKAGQKKTVKFADDIKSLGFKYACLAGISVGKDDLVVPKEKSSLINSSTAKIEELQNHYMEGLITLKEKYNKTIDEWTSCSDKVSKVMMKNLSKDRNSDDINSIYMMLESGARGSEAQIKQLAGMRGLMAKPNGEIIETPIISNFKEGLSVLEYFNSTHGARKGLADTALKTANSGYLTRRLVDCAQDAIIKKHDCGTVNGINITSVSVSGEIIASLKSRIFGRVLAEDIITANGDIIASSGQLIDDKIADIIELNNLKSVKVRSILTCEEKSGVCAKCYGMNMSTGKIASIGEAIGITAAQSIGEPGTQLTMRTFHIGGVAQGAVEKNNVEAMSVGTIKYVNLKVKKNSLGNNICMTSHGAKIAIVDDSGEVLSNYRIVYGATINIKNKAKVATGDQLAEWDPYSNPILAETSGTISYSDLINGITYTESTDEDTGIYNRIVSDWSQKQNKNKKLNPSIVIQDSKKNVKHEYAVVAGVIILVKNGDKVKAGDILARISRADLKTADITGGLPRVAELFEARKPKDFAILAPQEGTIEMGADYRSKKRLYIKSKDDKTLADIIIPKERYILVKSGDKVKKGDIIVDGALDLHDILEILGLEALTTYFVNEVQTVYRMQGVRINDKHIEVILNQMLSKVIITDHGSSYLVNGEEVNKNSLMAINNKIIAKGKEPAKYMSILQGITKSALRTQSFISAASFQETTRVLTEASIFCMEDDLVGLKENVIVGKLIPAGTGATIRNFKHQALTNTSDSS